MSAQDRAGLLLVLAVLLVALAGIADVACRRLVAAFNAIGGGVA